MKRSRWMKWLVVAAWGPLVLLGGCESHVVHEETMAPPTSAMSKMKGSSMPQSGGAPMPEGWKGFKAY